MHHELTVLFLSVPTHPRVGKSHLGKQPRVRGCFHVKSVLSINKLYDMYLAGITITESYFRE